jgi:hypothetical protein
MTVHPCHFSRYLRHFRNLQSVIARRSPDRTHIAMSPLAACKCDVPSTNLQIRSLFTRANLMTVHPCTFNRYLQHFRNLQSAIACRSPDRTHIAMSPLVGCKCGMPSANLQIRSLFTRANLMTVHPCKFSRYLQYFRNLQSAIARRSPDRTHIAMSPLAACKCDMPSANLQIRSLFTRANLMTVHPCKFSRYLQHFRNLQSATARRSPDRTHIAMSPWWGASTTCLRSALPTGTSTTPPRGYILPNVQSD